VSNQGSKWEHLAKIVEIIESTSSAVVKWDSTLKKDIVDLADCKKYDLDEVSERKRKATDFYQNSSMNNQMSKIFRVVIVLTKDVPVMACCVMGVCLETIHHLPTSQTFGFVVEMWFEKIPSASVVYCVSMAISQ
jgi:glutamine synthetase type III